MNKKSNGSAGPIQLVRPLSTITIVIQKNVGGSGWDQVIEILPNGTRRERWVKSKPEGET